MGMQVDRVTPDRFDLIGGMISLIGVLVTMFGQGVKSIHDTSSKGVVI